VVTNTARTRRLSAIIAAFAVCAATPLSADETANKSKVSLEPTDSNTVFSPDGKAIARGLVIWDIATGKQLAKGDEKAGHAPCHHVAFSPDGNYLASVHLGPFHDRSHAILLWRRPAANKLHLAATLIDLERRNTPYERSLSYLTFSPDSRMLATRHPDDSTTVWETASARERLHLNTRGIVVAFGRDGRTLISVTRDGLVQHWDLATRKCVAPDEQTKREDFLFVKDAVASADGSTVALTDGYSILIKDTRTGKTIRRFASQRFSRLPHLSPDGKMLTHAGELFDTATGKRLIPPNSEYVREFSPDGRSVLGYSENTVAARVIDRIRPTKRPAVPPKPWIVPLEATIISRQAAYVLDLQGMEPREYARLVRQGSLPPSPKIDLLLTLRNTSKETIKFDRKMEWIDFHLVGPGAMNYPTEEYQTDYRRSRPSEVVLAPGETYSIPIRSLDCGHSMQSFWLLPGEYTLYANCNGVWYPPHDRSEEEYDANPYPGIPVPPLRLKVVAANK
jgi:hypothetical protein